MALVIKKNDTLPWLRAILRQGNNDPIDLTTADSVKFLAKSGDKVISKSAAIIDALSGIVEVVWSPADTDTAGQFKCEFEITWDPGYIQTVPNDGYFQMVITEDLG